MTARATDHRHLPPAVFLLGPTASGKTALALHLVARFPCDIVSVDSAMVYRGMDIGSAKPSREELAAAPHRLIDIRDPSDPYSAASFREDALREMEQISGRGRIPLLVGGTMLYFRALQQGLSRLPGANPAIRRRLEEEARRSGWLALHARLAAVDPVSSRRIHPNDPQRIQRALEVFEISGKSMTELCRRKDDQPLAYRLIALALSPADRSVLHDRIDHRFHRMLQAGFESEVERLRTRGDLHAGLPAIRAVGYRQMWAYLEGELGRDEMIARAITATRQLAKRQLTWLRADQGLTWVDSESADSAGEARRRIERHLGM